MVYKKNIYFILSRLAGQISVKNIFYFALKLLNGSHPEALCQIWCKMAYRWHYDRCKYVFDFNLPILKNTFINITFMYFTSREVF